jgi:hypothetical protein
MLDAQSVLRRLIDGKVDFVVIGGLAMITHGSAHVTDDLDVCYRRTMENMSALAAALAPLHPKLRGAPADLPFLWDAQTIKAGMNFTLDTDLGPVDLLGEVAGVGDFDCVLASSDAYAVFGLPVRVLSLDGLIAAKKAAARRKDSAHLIELEELKRLRDEAQ